MGKLQLRVISESPTSHRWMIVDHVWDGISAPIAVSDESYPHADAAHAAGQAELQRLDRLGARDHPLQD